MDFVKQAQGTIAPNWETIQDAKAKKFFASHWNEFLTTKNAVYGVFEGTFFIVSPAYDSFVNTFAKECFGREMKADSKVNLATFIHKKGITLRPWKKPGKTLSYEKRKEFAEFRAMQSNADNSFRYRKGNSVRRNLPQMNADYQYQGQCAYSENEKRIEMNGKSVYLSKPMIEYMDGNGSGLRPLDTGCFIGSGEKIRFAKAGRF